MVVSNKMNTAIITINQDLKQNEFDQLSVLITYDKQTKIQKFRCYADAQMSLLGDVLARYMICKYNNLLNKNLYFNINEHGKPFLVNYPKIKYNISHASNYVVCVISNGIPVGIDVESIRSTDMKIAKRFFTSDEYNYLREQPLTIQNECFYKLWTMKESYIKMIGKGLSIPLNSFSVLNKESTNSAYFQQFIKSTDIIGHVCAENAEDVNCNNVDYIELVEWVVECTSK